MEVGRFVEGAMEGNRKRTGGFNEFAGVFNVDCVVGVKNAEDDAVHFAVLRQFDVAAHLGEFGAGIEKVATAGTDHREDGDFDGGTGAAHELCVRSDATDGEVGAEFDAVCAAAFGSDGGGKRFDGDFEEWGHGREGLVRGAVGIEQRFLSPEADRFIGMNRQDKSVGLLRSK